MKLFEKSKQDNKSNSIFCVCSIFFILYLLFFSLYLMSWLPLVIISIHCTSKNVYDNKLDVTSFNQYGSLPQVGRHCARCCLQ